MDLEEIKDAKASEGDNGDIPAVTAFKIEGETIYDLKDEVGTSTLQELAPLVEALIHEFLENPETAENKKDEFLNREEA